MRPLILDLPNGRELANELDLAIEQMMAHPGRTSRWRRLAGGLHQAAASFPKMARVSSAHG